MGESGELSRQAGWDIPYRDSPQAEYAALLKRFGLPDVLAEGLAAWDVDAAHGALFDEGRQLPTLIGRSPPHSGEAGLDSGHLRSIHSMSGARGSPLLEGEGQGEVCDLFGESTHLTPTLSFQERGPVASHAEPIWMEAGCPSR